MSTRTQDITRTQMQNLISKMPENKYRIPRNRLQVTEIVYNKMLSVAKKLDTKYPKNNIKHIISHITDNAETMKDNIYVALGVKINDGTINNYQLGQIANGKDTADNELLCVFLSLQSHYLREITRANHLELPIVAEDEMGLMLSEATVKYMASKAKDINIEQ